MAPEADSEPRITRRSVVAAGVGAVASAAIGGLPAWARSARHTYPHRPGQLAVPGIPPIEQVVVLMLENHSFDNVLGMLPYRVPSRVGVDGLPGNGRVPTASNPDANGQPVVAFHELDDCPTSAGLTNNWDSSHRQYDNGHNNGFVTNARSTEPMGYFDDSDLPVTYALASAFPISDRYFCSSFGQTYPNRRFLYCATASGTISTTPDTFAVRAPNGTIFDRLDAARISWHVYSEQVASPLLVPNFRTNPRQVARCLPFDSFHHDARAGKLPHFSLLDPNGSVDSEENPQDVQYGETLLARVVAEIFNSPQWPTTVLFVTYDEHGGYFDHVPPPSAIKPDNTPPDLSPQHKGTIPGAYDRYGFRVPLTVISPWARAHYVSHKVADHTSILAFIERRWKLRPLTARDAHAWPLTDMFDLRKPAFRHPPRMPAAPDVNVSLARCEANGKNPPQPSLLGSPPSP